MFLSYVKKKADENKEARAMAHTKGEFGDILLSLCYQPNAAKLTVLVLKCRNLVAEDLNGYSDPYVKVSLRHDAKVIGKKKTSVRDKTLNPIFNESFSFTITSDKIRYATLHVAVLDYDKFSKNDYLGEVDLSERVGGNGTKHWKEMLGSSGQPVSFWHTLKEVVK